MTTRQCTACGADTANAKFCCRSCAVSYNNRIAPKRKAKILPPNVSRRRDLKDNACDVCGMAIKRAATYCSRECVGASRRLWYEAWLQDEYNPVGRDGYQLASLRNLVIKARGTACEHCGWDEVNPVSGLVPIELDHVDGDRRNNRWSNLRLLCPNCHALTPTYRYLNSSKSRATRGM